MKAIFNWIASILIVIGVIMLAGSAGDCDGKCVEAANSISQMLTYVAVGLAFFITGALILISNSKETV